MHKPKLAPSDTLTRPLALKVASLEVQALPFSLFCRPIASQHRLSVRLGSRPSRARIAVLGEYIYVSVEYPKLPSLFDDTANGRAQCSVAGSLRPTSRA